MTIMRLLLSYSLKLECLFNVTYAPIFRTLGSRYLFPSVLLCHTKCGVLWSEWYKVREGLSNIN